MLPLGLCLIFLNYIVAASSNFTTTDLFSDNKPEWVNGVVSESNKNFSILVTKADFIHTNSSYKSGDKINKTVGNEFWINNIISEDKKNSSNLVTRWPKIDISHTNSSYKSGTKINTTSAKNKLFSGYSLLKNFNGSEELIIRNTGSFLDLDQYTEIRNKTRKDNASTKSNKNNDLNSNITKSLSSTNQNVENIDDNYVDSSNKKFENKTFISMTDQPINESYLHRSHKNLENETFISNTDQFVTLTELKNSNHKLHTETSPIEVSSSTYTKEIIPAADSEINEITTGYVLQPSYYVQNVNKEKNVSKILKATGTNTKLDTTNLITSSEIILQHDEKIHNHTTHNHIIYNHTEKHGLLKKVDSDDLLRMTTGGFLDLDQYPEIRNKTRNYNSSMILNKNKFSNSNFTESLSSINQNVENIDDNYYLDTNNKKFENKTFISMTDQPVNTIKSQNFDHTEELHTEISPVEISSTYKKEIIPVTDNEINEITTSNELQFSHFIGNVSKEKNTSEIFKTTGINMKLDVTNLDTLSQLYDNVHHHLTTQSSIFFNRFNITSSRNTTESLRVHSPVETQTIHETEFTTESSIANIYSMKYIEDTKEVTENDSKESVTDKAERENNYSGITEISIDPVYKTMYVLPEKHNTTDTWETYNMMDPDNEISLNNTDLQYETQTTEIMNPEILNYTECKSNPCLDEPGTSELPYKNYNSIKKAVSDTDQQSIPYKSKNISEINDTETIQATGSQSITSKGRTVQPSLKPFLMKPWKNLTAEILQKHCITIVFQTTDNGNLWLSSYDLKFRRFILYILNKMKATSNIVYISPTPISINGKLLVAFVVETQIGGNDTYELGLNISQQLNDHKEKLQTMMDTKINKIQVGFPEILKKDSYCETNNECASLSISCHHIIFTICITVIVVTLLVLCIAIHWRWTARFLPEQHDTEDSTNLTDPVELNQPVHAKAQDGTNNEAYRLKVLTNFGVTDSTQNNLQEKSSTSHNSVCTLDQ